MEKKMKIKAKEKPRSKSQKKRAKREVDMKDFEDFCTEERLVKKLKKGISRSNISLTIDRTNKCKRI